MGQEVSLVQDQSFMNMLWGSGAVVKFVLLLLIFLSVLSWGITFAKFWMLWRAKADSVRFNGAFWTNKNFARLDDMAREMRASPLAQMFSAGYREIVHGLQSERKEHQDGPLIDRVRGAVRRAELHEVIRLERGTTFLATVASAAPFIGLFGTVWGIMTAFQGLAAAKGTTIQAVAPGISEALIATAIGLAAAIPAAIAYNYFISSVKYLRMFMDRFSHEFLALAEDQCR